MSIKEQVELEEYSSLHEANVARQREWDPDDRITLAYRGNELAGEIGEACNVIKKLERERLGINGSRDTVEHLMEELADGVICSFLCAMHVGGNLDAAIEAKFNATSEKMGLKTRLRRAPAAGGVREALAKLLIEDDSEDADEECDLCGGRGTLDAYTDRTNNDSRAEGRDEVGCPACIERHHSRVIRSALAPQKDGSSGVVQAGGAE